MHIKAESNKRFLVIDKASFLNIGKTAGWFDNAKTVGKALFNPNDYLKGLKAVEQIRQQRPQDQAAHWNAFQNVPQIGKGLAQLQKNLGFDIQIFTNLVQHGKVYLSQKAQNPAYRPEPKMVQEIQWAFNALSPTGKQILTQAIQTQKVNTQDNSLSLDDLENVVTECLRASKVMQEQSKAPSLELQESKGNPSTKEIIDLVMGLPVPQQIKIVTYLMDQIEYGKRLSV